MFSSSASDAHLPQSYLLLRLGTGLCFAVHGALRFAQIEYFSELWQSIEAINLPDTILVIYAYVMPAVELIAGFLLCFGFMKKWAIVGLSLVMLTWILSSVLMEYWQNMAPQLIFFFLLYWLYFKINDDHWSFDRFLKL